MSAGSRGPSLPPTSNPRASAHETLNASIPWLRLANLQLPARTANSLLDRFGAPEALFDATPASRSAQKLLADIPGLNEGILQRLWDTSFLPTSKQLEYLESASVQVLPRDDPDYPRNLKEIPDPPPVLFLRGSLEERDRFAVAIVGSRSATPYGRAIAASLARDLSAAGLTIVSGGAMGIDTAAHQGAIDGAGRTLVILGCGLDIDYPKENRRLFDRIVDGRRGALITEFPLGATPEPWRFPMRNRIISGLTPGVVVVEAGARSGALLTATNAAEQGRDVMAVPGNVDRQTSKGTNALIRDGAILVEDARDVLRALNMLVLDAPSTDGRPRKDAVTPPAPAHLPENQQRLLEFLSLTPRHIDALAADTRLASTQVSVEMTLLELSGLVRRLPGNCYVRVL